MFQFVSFPAIVVICYLIGEACKAFKNETVNKFIPTICGTVGGGLGILIFFTIPDFIPAENWAGAVAVGIVSGFAATGINQIYKQMTAK